MVLAELTAHVAQRFEQFRECRIFVRETLLRARQTHLQQTGANRALAGNECGAAGGTGLLTVVVSQNRALVRDPIDVGCAVAIIPRL